MSHSVVCSKVKESPTEGLVDINEEKLSSVQTAKQFKYEELETATGNFSPESKIGEGGFGSVYKVQECYELSARYEGKHNPKKLEELGNVLTSLDAGDSIVVAKAFSNMLNLANLAEEVQIAYRRRNKKKKGDYTDESNATTESNIEETLKRLVFDLKKTPQEVFDALKNQTVDLVLTAHPT